MLAAMFLALGCTTLIFTPLLYLQMWYRRPR